MRHFFRLAMGSALLLMGLAAQQSDILIKLTQGEKPALAVPDFRGAGAAQPLVNAFNQTLFSDLDASGIYKMVSKSLYPLQIPQQPSDFREPPPPQPEPRS